MAYTKITQEEAKYLMDTRDDILIIDVRNPEEFAEGHIPHAINIPNPSITNRDIPELPDKNQEHFGVLPIRPEKQNCLQKAGHPGVSKYQGFRRHPGLEI